jgi:hypothetical protein
MGMGEALRLSGQLISYGKSKYERDRVDVTSSERQAVDKFTGLPLFEEDGVTPVMLVSGSEKSRRYKDKEGDPLPESIDPITALRQAQGALGVETPAERKRASVSALEAEWKKGFANRTDKSLDEAAWAKSEGKEIEGKLAAERAKPVSDFSQDEAKKEEAVSGLDERIAEIQAEIDALSAPEVGFDTNVLSRTREAFGGMAGVGGLGFAPRRSKISPIYDEGRAREAMAAQRTGAEQAIALAASKNEADLRASVLDRKKATSRERIRELTVARGLASGDEAAAIDEAIAKLSAEPTLTAQEELSVRTSSRNAALEDFRNLSLETGPGPRTRREFMDREPSGTKDFPIDDLKKEYIAALRKASLAEDPEVEEEPPPRIEPDAPAAPAGPTQTRTGTPRPTDPRPTAPVSSDLDIFRRITEEEEEITLPPVPPLIPQSMTPDAPPPLKGAGPGSLPYQKDPPLIFGGGVIDQEEPAAAAAPPKVSDTDIEIAEDNDPDIYKKAFEFFQNSSNPEIAKDPPAYFAGPQPGGRKPPAGAGQKEMVRAYLEQYTEETDNEDKVRIKGGKLDPDLAREAEGEVANLYKKASSIDSYLEKMDPTEQEKQELYNAYQDRIKDDRLMSDRDLADLYIEKLTEMREKKDKPKAEGSQGSIKKPKTRSEVYASNLLKIINTGKTLADKPSKLARIAKPDLPEKERSKVVPEHILLVDKLYNINKGRSSAFKSTYDEIERVYKTDEKKKKAALEYLAAKEILTSEMA